MKPTWMGDSGFADEHLSTWRKAEDQFELKNEPPTKTNNAEADSPNFDLKFEPCKNF